MQQVHLFRPSKTMDRDIELSRIMVRSYNERFNKLKQPYLRKLEEAIKKQKEKEFEELCLEEKFILQLGNFDYDNYSNGYYYAPVKGNNDYTNLHVLSTKTFCFSRRKFGFCKTTFVGMQC